MWKYQCKTHLIALLAAFFLGAFLAFFSLQQGLDLSAFSYPEEVVDYINNNKILFYMAGGLSIAGIVNVIFMIYYAGNMYNINPVVLIVILMFFTQPLMYIGTLLVIPAIIVCIYGIITSRNELRKEYQNAKVSDEEEIFRIYKNTHKLDETVKPLALACRNNVIRITAIYILGVIAVLFVMTLINNLFVLVISLVFYLLALNLLLRYRSSSIIPIAALLYESCDPEACASAIFYYSQWRGRMKLKQHALLAQCLIYLDDPQLAQDVLVHFPKKDAASILQYWSLMAYVYYLLKDESDLQRCKVQADKVQLNAGKTGVLIQSEEKRAIQNKIDLMNGELNTSKKYYLHALKQARFPFQQVDASYYIGLISFVQEDYSLANMYFNKVIDFGNKMCFVAKAKKYLELMENMEIDSKEEMMQ
ncbi:MAG: hypothetical protein J6D18_01560 [Erysipelotrichaceae bacterium]|nr:hypothetical protein [Erysipelotrichaceae bacterium]